MTRAPSLASWDQPGTRLLEYVFVASVPLGVFIALAFLLENVIEGSLPTVLHLTLDTVYLGLIASLYLGTWLAVRTYRSGHPEFLATPSGFTAAEAVPRVVGWSLVSYLGIGLVLGTVAFVGWIVLITTGR